LQVRRAVIDAIVEHAQRDSPLECCGLLIGNDDEVSESRTARNTRESAVRYLVDPRDHFEAIRDARAMGLAVVGAYHSHPRSPAEPSETDVQEANDPDFVHMIVSLADVEPQIAAFRIGDGRPIRLPLAIVI
jgi:proteasome lid subunit RPN8/RPN11